MKIAIITQKSTCAWRKRPELYGKHNKTISLVCDILEKNHIAVTVWDSVEKYLESRHYAGGGNELIFSAIDNCFERNRAAVLPSIWEFLEIPYIGNDPYAMTVTTDKKLFQEICEKLGILCPRCVEINHHDDERRIKESTQNFTYPLILKYRYGTMSYGLSLVYNFEELLTTTQSMLSHEPKCSVLCQEFIDGKEAAVPIIGSGSKAHSLAAIEYTGPNQSRIKLYDMQWKNELDNLVELVPLSDVNVAQTAQNQCLKLYQYLGLRDMARFDLRITDAGEIYFLETNCMPNLGYESAFDPQSYGGDASFEDILLEIISSARERNREKVKI